MPYTINHGPVPEFSHALGHVSQASRPGFGFTLIEMVVSLSVMSIVFLAMGSVMLLATEALPKPDAPAGLAFEAADVLRQLASELETATAVSLAGPAVIDFTVPDRNNDASDETIKYEWSGTAGDPLLRQYNGGAAVAVLSVVSELQLTYTVDVPPDQTPPEIESAEQLYLRLDNTVFPNQYTWNIGAGEKLVQTFRPTLPAEAVTWRITRIQAYLDKIGNANGQNAVVVTAVDSGGLPGQVIEQIDLPESSITAGWNAFTFSNAGGLDPTKYVGVGVFSLQMNGSIKVYTGWGSPGPADTALYIEEGWGYQQNIEENLHLWVWGTYAYTDPNWTPSGGPLDSVSITLNQSTDPATRRYAQVNTLNRPVMP